jgi:peptide-methionine (S)-S-oxide reductase
METGKYKFKMLIWSVMLLMTLIEYAPANPAGSPGGNKEVLTLGGGCFWCIEAVFDMVKGVSKVESGYSGGQTSNPTYKEVCTGTTGHAEVVQITFDPAVISMRDLLEIFFIVHDPTQLNRQGPDVGTQYRSAIFYRTSEQKLVAEQTLRELEEKKIYPGKVVTQLVPFATFYPAEDYHQEYYQLNGTQPYCRAVIAPKIAKFRKMFHDKLKS